MTNTPSSIQFSCAPVLIVQSMDHQHVCDAAVMGLFKREPVKRSLEMIKGGKVWDGEKLSNVLTSLSRARMTSSSISRVDTSSETLVRRRCHSAVRPDRSQRVQFVKGREVLRRRALG